jgi:hypothetical protein
MSSGSITATGPQQIPYGITNVNASAAWLSSGNNKQGKGVHVAVIDTGIIFTHPDLADNYIGGATFMPGTNSRIDEGVPEDDGSFTYHGTHVAGTIAAIDNDQGVVGCCGGVATIIDRKKIIFLRKMNRNGTWDSISLYDNEGHFRGEASKFKTLHEAEAYLKLYKDRINKQGNWDSISLYDSHGNFSNAEAYLKLY